MFQEYLSHDRRDYLPVLEANFVALIQGICKDRHDVRFVKNVES